MTSEDQLIRALHDEHAGALYGFVLRYVNDPGKAEDVVQETMLRAWRHLDGLSVEGGNPRGYLFRVARNVLTDLWRAEERRPRVVADDTVLAGVPSVPGQDDVDRALEGWLIADALSRLSAEHRAVVQALYYEGRSIAETAAALGVPEGTVKSRSYYAVRALRTAFEEMGVVR